MEKRLVLVSKLLTLHQASSRLKVWFPTTKGRNPLGKKVSFSPRILENFQGPKNWFHGTKCGVILGMLIGIYKGVVENELELSKTVLSFNAGSEDLT